MAESSLSLCWPLLYASPSWSWDRLLTVVQAGLLFRRGVPPHATYLFKHALVRAAAHARIAETLESQFADVTEAQPELLARHFTEASLIKEAAGRCRKAELRSRYLHCDLRAHLDNSAGRNLEEICSVVCTSRKTNEKSVLPSWHARLGCWPERAPG